MLERKKTHLKISEAWCRLDVVKVFELPTTVECDRMFDFSTTPGVFAFAWIPWMPSLVSLECLLVDGSRSLWTAGRISMDSLSHYYYRAKPTNNQIAIPNITIFMGGIVFIASPVMVGLWQPGFSTGTGTSAISIVHCPLLLLYITIH